MIIQKAVARRRSAKKVILKISQNFLVLESLFNEAASLKAWNFI